MGTQPALAQLIFEDSSLLHPPPDAGEGFKCDRCGKVFAYKYYRDKHLKYTRCVDQGDRKFPCHLCNRSFEKRDRLRIHILHVHEKHRPHKVSGVSQQPVLKGQLHAAAVAPRRPLQQKPSLASLIKKIIIIRQN